MLLLMFCTLRFLQRIRSKTLVSTHTPRTSAAIAALTFHRNCDLTDCHPCLSVYTFDHDSAAAPAIVFVTSIPEASYRLPRCVRVFPVENNFSTSLCASVGPVICLLIMFSENVFHEVVDIRDRFGSSSLPP